MATGDSKNEPKERAQQDGLPFYRRVEIYVPLIFIGGIAFALLIYTQGLILLGWSSEPLEDSSQVAMATPFSAPSASEVVLYVSPTTKRYLGDVGGNYELIVNQWRNFLAESQRPFREVDTPSELEKIGKSVLIVPTGVALADTERTAFFEHQQRGGSILASGPLGARDDAGQWREWQLMKDLFGVQVRDEVQASAPQRYLVTVGDGPITQALPAGSRIWLGSSSEPAIRFAGGNAAGTLGNWTRTPDDAGPTIVYGDVKGARWVVFGFTENSWDSQPYQLKILAASALDWLQAKPKSYVAAWPKLYRSAQLIEMDIEEDVPNALNLHSMLEAVQIRGAFYTLTEGVTDSAATLAKLSAGHEIGFHGDTMIGFKGQTLPEQQRRLQLMKTQLAPVYPKANDIRGFKSPGDSFDETTEVALQSLGFLYHVADANRTQHRLPIFASDGKVSPEKDLVILSRTELDDIGYLIAPGITPIKIAAALKAEISAVLEQGALGVLNLHSRNFAKDSPMQQGIASLLIYLAEHRQKIWSASGSDIAAWWRKRGGLRTRINVQGSRQELELTYYGSEPVLNPVVIVLHPYKSQLALKPTRAWIPAPTVVPLDDYRSAVVFDEVKKGNYAYQVVFSK